MATQAQTQGWFFRLGRAGRRGLRSYSLGEQQLAGWLVANGLPFRLASAVTWAARLAFVGIMLYAAFWFALLLLFGVAAAWVAANTEYDQFDPPPEWKVGHSGFGLYDNSDWRIDSGASDDDER